MRQSLSWTRSAISAHHSVRCRCSPVSTRSRRGSLRNHLQRYPAGLTPREVDVLRLLPRGLSNAEIAAALFVSPRTVQTHLSNLYTKLGIAGRAEAIAFAAQPRPRLTARIELLWSKHSSRDA